MRIGNFPNVGKPAGLVLVRDLEAAQRVRDLYPAESIKFMLDPHDQMLSGRFESKAVWTSVLTLIAGGVMGSIGYAFREKKWGQLLMGAGGSMIGTSAVLMIRDLQD